MVALETKSLTLSYGAENIIDHLDVKIPKGEITVLVGANGCGKSTLLRSLARLMKPKEGSVVLDGQEISSMSTKEVAKKMAILPQAPIAPEGLTVLQLVKQGRYPHQKWLQQWSKKDEEKVQEALKATNMEAFADRPVDALSGGQRQRAWIAMTLAQETETILLDEPTTYLDMSHQIEILDLLFELNEQDNRTIVMVLHDLNLASRYAHNMIALQNHCVFAQGQPEHIVDAGMVQRVFCMECQIVNDPHSGTPMCIPFGKSRKVRPSYQKQSV